MANEMNPNIPILTIDADTPIETVQTKEDTIWHEIQNAYRTQRILTGNLGGIEKLEGGDFQICKLGFVGFFKLLCYIFIKSASYLFFGLNKAL